MKGKQKHAMAQKKIAIDAALKAFDILKDDNIVGLSELLRHKGKTYDIIIRRKELPNSIWDKCAR